MSTSFVSQTNPLTQAEWDTLLKKEPELSGILQEASRLRGIAIEEASPKFDRV